MLTPKQQAYVEARVKGAGPSEAYRLAYSADRMSPNAIAVEASRLESHPNVSLILTSVTQKALTTLEVTAERVLQEYARIAFSDMRHFASVNKDGIDLKDSDDWSDDDAAAVAELGETTSKDGGSVRFKLHSKTAALDALAKHLRMFGDGDQDNGAKHLHLHGLNESQLRALADGFSA